MKIKKMLHEGAVDPVNTERDIPIFFAPNKDRAMRFCVDYSKLNTATVRDLYSQLGMDESIDYL